MVRIKTLKHGFTIEEIVTPDGKYIVWAELFTTYGAAEKHLLDKGYVLKEFKKSYLYSKRKRVKS